MHQHRTIRDGEGLGQRAFNLIFCLNRNRRGAKSLGPGDEIWVGKPDRGIIGAARIAALMMHADGAVAGIIRKDDHRRDTFAHGGRDFIAGHQNPAITHKGDRPLALAHQCVRIWLG